MIIGLVEMAFGLGHVEIVFFFFSGGLGLPVFFLCVRHPAEIAAG